MRITLCAIMVFMAFLGVTILQRNADNQPPFLYQTVIANFESDTAAHNAVAAVLLNYRMYDTMFEALILLTAIIGMQQFLPRKVDIEGEGTSNEQGGHDAE